MGRRDGLIALMACFGAFSLAATASQPFAGKYLCTECEGGARPSGLTSCWSYAIVIGKAPAHENPKVSIEIEGFQTARKFEARAAVEGDTASLHILDERYPVLTVFRLVRKAGKFFLRFVGYESNTGVAEISCDRKAN